ncbi:DFR1 [Candida oxycetoniae]|uniref:Dihydrofolate reductase n=1 Tax=Candida oxycetoniae TaxID=497107 RepID=A0AAI9WXU0_9ASCO|nr:DFR1 [Candida oxycetoniae]KAI3404588.1 DFR1 [Candida oxycetoniae]
MAYFKRVTMRTTDPGCVNAVVMGRKTWESIPSKFRPLPNRLNVILSRKFANRQLDETTIEANSIQSSLDLLRDKNIEKVFIIGGAEIYQEAMKSEVVDNLLITEISHLDPSSIEMDTFLQFPMDQWERESTEQLKQLTGESDIETDIQEGDFTYNYTLWSRK